MNTAPPVSAIVPHPDPLPMTPDAIEHASRIAADMTPTELAAEYEALDAVRAAHTERADYAKACRGVVELRLRSLLGEGESVTAPSGRECYLGLVSAGRATIREDVALELAAELPDDLTPRQVWRLPTVTAVKSAARAGRITRSTAKALIAFPAKVHGLRWKTVNDLRGMTRERRAADPRGAGGGLDATGPGSRGTRRKRMREALDEHTRDLDELAMRPEYHPVLHHQQIDNIRERMRADLAADDAAPGER